MSKSLLITFNWSSYGSALPSRPFGARYLLLEGKDSGQFYIADTTKFKHSEIEIPGGAKILGGGCMYYYGPDIGFVLCDESLDYGKANHERTKHLLNERYPTVPVAIE